MDKLNFSSLQNMASDRGISIGIVFKAIVLAYVITLITFFIFAVVITYSNFPERSIPTVVVVTTVLSIVFAGMKVASRAKTKGWLNGAIAGAVYMIVLYFISALALTGFVLDRYVIYMLFLGIISGAFGGIIGINFNYKSNKKRS